MQFSIKVITTSVENKGKYNMLEVAYKRLDTGKVESKKLMSFVYPDVYKAVVDAKGEDVFTITSEKNDKTGYWDWTAAKAEAPGHVAAAPAAYSKGTSTGVVKSTYETPEERAKKQVYIVKQSCLAQSIALLSVGAKTPPSSELILKEAQTFVDWVFEDNKTDVPSLVDMPNDFPDVE